MYKTTKDTIVPENTIVPETLPLETCVFRCLWQSGDIYGCVRGMAASLIDEPQSLTAPLVWVYAFFPP